MIMDILPQLIANSIIAGARYALIALGFNLIYTTAKFVNIAHGATAAVGGYIVFALTKFLGAHFFIAIPIGILGAGILGVFFEIGVFSKLRKRNASGLVLFLASLGIFITIEAFLAILFSSQFQSLSLGRETIVYRIGSAAITDVQTIMLLAGGAIFAGLGVFLRRTRFGTAVRAIADDEEVAKILGINTERIVRIIFFIGSAIAGIAGIFIGFDAGLYPTMGLLVVLEGAIASIIGGIGNISGGFLGAFLLGFIENFGTWKIASEWRSAIAFAVLILFLIFRPQGIMKK